MPPAVLQGGRKAVLCGRVVRKCCRKIFTSLLDPSASCSEAPWSIHGFWVGMCVKRLKHFWKYLISEPHPQSTELENYSSQIFWCWNCFFPRTPRRYVKRRHSGNETTTTNLGMCRLRCQQIKGQKKKAWPVAWLVANIIDSLFIFTFWGHSYWVLSKCAWPTGFEITFFVLHLLF